MNTAQTTWARLFGGNQKEEYIMETVDLKTGREYRVNYRKLRITKITDLRESHKLLVEVYLRISYNQRINLKAFIPYSALANEFRDKGEDAYIVTHDAAINLIENVILKLPVGVHSEELSLFEYNLLNAVCRTLVMANPTLAIQDISIASPALVALMEYIENNSYQDITIPLDEIAKAVGVNEVETEMELWSGRPFVNISRVNGVDTVSASAELVSLFYDISNRPRFTEKDIIEEEYYYDDCESDIDTAENTDDFAPFAADDDWGFEVPEDLGHTFPENLE